MVEHREFSERAFTLHHDALALVIDGLQAAPMMAEHFERLRRGGIHAVNCTTVQVTSDFDLAVLEIRSLIRTIERHSDQVMLVKQGSDILQARVEVECIASKSTSYDVRGVAAQVLLI